MKDTHIFLTEGEEISSLKLLNLIKSCNLSKFKKDAKILQELAIELVEKGIPNWMTVQEFSYIRGIQTDSEKVLKYIIFRYKFKTYPQKKIVTNFPIYVLVEPVSSCNLRCPFCFQVDKDFTRKPYAGIMKMSLFKQVIDECKNNGTQAITLASRGEPTLHPKLPDMLEYLNGKFFEVKLNTNGTRLTEELCHAIFKNNVNDIVLSIDTEDKELFEELRKNASFEKVLENVKLLNRIRKNYYPDSNTVIRISGVQCRPEQNNESFVKFWEGLADEITIGKMEERWDTYNNPVNLGLTTPCRYLWERFYVWHDGTCNPCDVDYKSKLSPGVFDINNNSIKSIWNSDKYKKLRLDHLKKLRSNYVPCDRCGVC
jgi:MoaA/NifB/PqqE/SkfB family radical SAM enzyme